ncbi:MAG: 4-hydroxythreonine-4-phosphate dehydrogenase PdxA [Desulfobacteraceae bacterium]|nr:MAG: 4-hydroxythreonine-4-phosphate dehydrogenase PdxA [Desulfobacteraceae bacterium]
MKKRPFIGITMGDPAGIGPEVIVKALSDPRIHDLCRPVVFGDRGALNLYVGKRRVPAIREISHPSEALGKPRQIDLIAVCSLDQDVLTPGIPKREGGEAMVGCIVTAVEMAKTKELSAVVTCPISKALMQRAGYAYEGHTQLIASLTRCRDYVMMLAGKKLRVALVTIHCALKDVPALLSKEKVFKTIRITAGALEQDFGIPKPRIAVAALNPHAGEEGLFGEEEESIIRPAIRKAKAEGYRVEGPFPADTLFYRAAGGEFDAVVAMYHDQGLIPLKLLHFSDAVNVTLGLPVVRTSVDHGTAYDIAGKDIADPSSLKAAIEMAVQMSRNREKREES